jgi:NADPH:quinone reductase-like Zn-dependent oxidoreductase
METMKAFVYNRRADSSMLVFEEIEKPEPMAGEVLVKIRYVALNAADYRSMEMRIIPKKRIFGADVSGVVVATGPEVKKLKVGDEVFGDLASFGFGGLAEYVAVNEKALVIKPSSVSFEDAASLPMATLTALQALRRKSSVSPGKKVLVVGSGGGVGTFAVQIAKYFGAEVTAVCGPANVEQTLSLGADKVIDYTLENFTKTDKKYDIILGVNGNYPLLAYRRLLASGGIFVMIGGKAPQILKSLLFGRLLSFGKKKMTFIAAKPSEDDLNFIAGLMENKTIRTVIDRRFKFGETREAFEYLRKGHARGKVVIKVCED